MMYCPNLKNVFHCDEILKYFCPLEIGLKSMVHLMIFPLGHNLFAFTKQICPPKNIPAYFRAKRKLMFIYLRTVAEGHTICNLSVVCFTGNVLLFFLFMSFKWKILET